MVICLILILSGCTPKIYPLSTSVTPSGGGTVSPSGGSFQGKVTLVATPAQYYTFSGWAGSASGNTNPLTVTMNSDEQIVATFARLTYNLQAQPDSTNDGTVQPSSGTIEAGTSETITAIPANGYRFDHWQGGATGSSNPLKIVMTSNITLTAYFTKVYTLTTSCSPIGDGNVSPGNGSYDAGTVQSIAASTTLFPYAFDHWSGTDNDNINPTTVTMNGDKSLTVYFKQLTAGQSITKSAHDTSNATDSISIPLNQYEWVSGQANGGDCHAYIKGPDGSTIADLGSISATTDFSFNADVSGNYIIVIQTGGNTLGFYDYTVTYTVYHY